MISKKEMSRTELTPEQVREKLQKLQDGVKEAYNVMKTLLPEAIVETDIREFGNSSHIILPKEYAKKKAIVIIKK